MGKEIGPGAKRNSPLDVLLAHDRPAHPRAEVEDSAPFFEDFPPGSKKK